MNFAHFCEFWYFSLGKQAQFILNFCSGMPLRKVHELTFLWFGLLGPLLTNVQSQPSEFPTENSGSLEIFNLAWKFQSRRGILKMFNLWALYMLKWRELFSALLLTRSGCQSPTDPSKPPTSSLPGECSQAHHPAPWAGPPPPSHRARQWTLIGENKG